MALFRPASPSEGNSPTHPSLLYYAVEVFLATTPTPSGLTWLKSNSHILDSRADERERLIRRLLDMRAPVALD